MQNFVYMTSCATFWKFTVNPSWSSWSLNTSAVSEPGGESSATMVMSQSPSHLPDENPAAFMYFSATAMSPFGFETKSRFGPASPPASSNPLIPGGM